MENGCSLVQPKRLRHGQKANSQMPPLRHMLSRLPFPGFHARTASHCITGHRLVSGLPELADERQPDNAEPNNVGEITPREGDKGKKTQVALNLATMLRTAHERAGPEMCYVMLYHALYLPLPKSCRRGGAEGPTGPRALRLRLSSLWRPNFRFEAA